MKRFVIILMAGAVGLGATAAVGFARAGGGRPTAALEGNPAASPATPSHESEALKKGAAPSREEASEKPKQPIEAPAAAPCDPEAILPVIRKVIDPAPGMFWESVDIAECQNGYARVWAITGGTPPPATQYEGGEQAVLQDVAGEWTMLSSGTGLDCYPTSMPPDLKDACEALGL